MGALATGSGALFTSAGFQSSTQPDSDLRVVVDQNLQFGANPDLDIDGRDDLTDNPGFFDDTDSDDSGVLNETSEGAFNEGNETSGFDDNGSDGFDINSDPDDNGFNEGFEPSLPLAYVDGVNDDLVVKAAVPVGTTHTFDSLFRLSNTTGNTIEFGIAYDRDGEGNGTNGNYGIDIDGNPLTANQAQQVYQFKRAGNNSLISPDPDDNSQVSGSSNNITISNPSDQPASLVEVGPGGQVDIDLSVDASTDEDDIREAAELDEAAFGFQTDTVQIIDVITVVSQPVP
jgi:hypothetical protein